MGWWPLPDSADDVTGDGSADAVDAALGGLAAARQSRGEALPSAGQLCAAVAQALAARRGAIDGVAAQVRVGMRAGGEAAADAPADLLDAVLHAVDGIVREFREDRRRSPRVAEVLYAFTFALGGQPETLLAQPLSKPLALVLRQDG